MTKSEAVIVGWTLLAALVAALVAIARSRR
jgi:hypothetical protein